MVGLNTLFQGKVSADEFLRKYWPNHPLIHQAPIGRLDSILSIPELRSLEVLVDSYKTPISMWNRDGKTIREVKGREAIQLYRKGWTIYMAKVDRFIPGIGPVLKQLEKDLGLRWGAGFCNAFASKAGTGAGPHFDYAWGFSVQLRGTKTWYLSKNTSVVNPTTGGAIGFGPGDDDSRYYGPSGYPKKMPKPALVQKIGPGGVVFNPRGWWHRTVAHQDSFAIDLEMDPRPWADYALSELRRLLFQREEWRACPLGIRSSKKHQASVQRYAKNLMNQLPTLVKNIDFDSVWSQAMGLPENLDFRWRFKKDRKAKAILKSNKKPGSWIIEIRHPETGRTKIEIVDRELLSLWNWLEEREGNFTGDELLEAAAPASAAAIEKVIRFFLEPQYLRRIRADGECD